MGKYQELQKLEKHPHYFINPISMKITFRRTVKGYPIKISTGETSIAKAKLKVDDALARRFSNDHTKEKRKRLGITNPLIKDLWDELIDEKESIGASKSSMNSYHSAWTYGIAPFWGDKTCNEISDKTQKLYEAWYLKDNPERTYFNTMKYLGMLFRYIQKKGYIRHVPQMNDLDITIAKTTKKERVGRVYTEDEIEAILDEANDRTRLGVMFGCFMGCRKMEFLSLEKKRINWKEQYVNVWSFKNKHWREIPLPPRVLKELKEFCESHDSKFIFPMPTDHKRHIASQVFDKDWTNTKIRAGISNATVENAARVHDLRHTFATMTARDNWPPAVACKVLDMSLEEYMHTYVHITRDDVFKWMRNSFGEKK